MLDPKYDPNNYLKHQTIPIIQDNHKINESFGSYLLMVKWWFMDTRKLPQSNQTGILRIHQKTPFGNLEPQNYQLRLSNHKDIYVQFVNIPKPDFEYKIEVLHPDGIAKSWLEIWEYIDPLIISSNPTPMNYIGVPGSDPALLAATQANATAIASLATTMASQPGAIADAIANNAMIDENFPNTLVGSTLMQLLSIDQTRQSVFITNWHTVAIKLWKSTAPLAASTVYSSDGAFITLDPAKVIGGILIQGGVATLDADEAKQNIYAIGNGAAGTKGVAITLTRTAP
jgi:hypothetical protein